MDAKSLLLTTAFRHVISEPNVEAGFEAFRAITRCGNYDLFRDAVANCLREGLIREPIRLPEGALQCHWHLELTPNGVAMARSLIMAEEAQPSKPSAPPAKEVVDGRAKPGHDD